MTTSYNSPGLGKFAGFVTVDGTVDGCGIGAIRGRFVNLKRELGMLGGDHHSDGVPQR